MRKKHKVNEQALQKMVKIWVLKKSGIFKLEKPIPACLDINIAKPLQHNFLGHKIIFIFFKGVPFAKIFVKSN